MLIYLFIHITHEHSTFFVLLCSSFSKHNRFSKSDRNKRPLSTDWIIFNVQPQLEPECSFLGSSSNSICFWISCGTFLSKLTALLWPATNTHSTPINNESLVTDPPLKSHRIYFPGFHRLRLLKQTAYWLPVQDLSKDNAKQIFLGKMFAAWLTP